MFSLTLSNVNSNRAEISAHCDNEISVTLPQLKNSEVSTPRVYFTPPIANRKQVTTEEPLRWYALRTTYGREQAAYDYLTAHGCEAYLPKMKVMTEVNGKRRWREVSRVPNIFFAHACLHELETFVFDNVHLPYLRFYYEERRTADGVQRVPLVVPDRQMESFMLVCGTMSPNLVTVPESVHNFTHGEHVVVTEGEFKGVEGYVARWHGQQRVAVVIEHLCTIATAYIPSAFLKPLKEN